MAEKAGLKHVKMQKVEWIIDFFNLNFDGRKSG